MSQLETEIAAFETMRTTLEAEHPGKWVVIRGRALIDAYDSFNLAASEAVRQFGRGPYLIRQVGSGPVIIPASAMYAFRHASD